MTDRSVLITGCSSGIGRDAARTLAGRGWRVFATCRQPQDCARLQAEGLESFPLDHASEASVAAGVAETLARSGGTLGALVLNGAHALPGAIEDVPRAGLRAIFEANVFGPQDVARRLLPALRARQGRIVAVSSVLGVVSLPFRGPYCASKYALEALCDALRLELAGSGVHVSLIEPGPIATRFRLNAVPHFEAHIDWRASAQRERYEAEVLPRLYATAPAPDRFERPPAAVTARLIRALEAPRPAPRYRVTTPAYLAEIMRRLMPTRLRDRVIAGW